MTVIEHHRLPRQLLHNHFFREASHIRELLGIRGRRRIGQEVPNVRGRKRNGLITRCITTPERLDLTSRRQTNPRQCMLRIPGLLGSSFFFYKFMAGWESCIFKWEFLFKVQGACHGPGPKTRRPENHDLGTRREERGFVLVFPYDTKSRRGNGGRRPGERDFLFPFFHFIISFALLVCCFSVCLPYKGAEGGV